MSSSHSLIRVLTEFELRARELTAAVADSAARTSPFARAASSSEPRARALRLASARRLWWPAPVPAQDLMSAGNRIATVAADRLRPLLAARVLYGCRDAIRRCIDRRTKQALSLSIGPTAFAALQEHALTSTCGQPMPDDLSADSLARRGLALMLADGACAHPTLRRMVELGLALSKGDDIWQNVLAAQRDTLPQAGAVSPDGATSGMNATDEFLSVAGLLFPEFQWLFG